MKIAILQLARFGDILMTWPLVRAIKRNYPGATVTMVVRETYKEAVRGLQEVDSCCLLPAQYLLEPLLKDIGAEAALQSIARIESLMEQLKNSEFDWVINLSFSPLSADICSIFPPSTKITGYGRFSDGALRLNGQPAQYFYAQVGVQRPNRLHLLDLFSRMCHVQLTPADFEMPTRALSVQPFDAPYITVHVGGSEAHKVLGADFLSEFCNSFLSHPQHGTPKRNIVLIGSSQEKVKADEIIANLPVGHRKKVSNHCGKTSIPDLFTLMQGADFHLGGDSLPVQISMFSQTPVVLLSFDGTNFWETGPLVQGSLVLRFSSKSEVRCAEVLSFLDSWFSGKQIQDKRVHIATGFFHGIDSTKFAHLWEEWNWTDLFQDLMNEFYFNQSEKHFLRLLESPLFLEAFEQLRQANEVVILQLQNKTMTSEQKKFLQSAAAQVDQIFEQIGQHHVLLAAVARWAHGLKSQVEPGTFEQIRTRSLKVYCHIQENLEKMKINEPLFTARLAAEFEKEKDL